MAEFVTFCTTDELKPGDREVYDVDGVEIALFNVDGQYYAIRDVCPHDDGPLAEGPLTDCVIKCPRHGAEFDIRSGQVLSPPAFSDVPVYAVRVVDGEVQVAI